MIPHALNINRDDIKSDEKVKRIFKTSAVDMQVDVEHIYTEIIKQAITAKNRFTFNKRETILYQILKLPIEEYQKSLGIRESSIKT